MTALLHAHLLPWEPLLFAKPSISCHCPKHCRLWKGFREENPARQVQQSVLAPKTVEGSQLVFDHQGDEMTDDLKLSDELFTDDMGPALTDKT